MVSLIFNNKKIGKKSTVKKKSDFKNIYNDLYKETVQGQNVYSSKKRNDLRPEEIKMLVMAKDIKEDLVKADFNVKLNEVQSLKRIAHFEEMNRRTDYIPDQTLTADRREVNRKSTFTAIMKMGDFINNQNKQSLAKRGSILDLGHVGNQPDFDYDDKNEIVTESTPNDSETVPNESNVESRLEQPTSYPKLESALRKTNTSNSPTKKLKFAVEFVDEKSLTNCDQTNSQNRYESPPDRSNNNFDIDSNTEQPKYWSKDGKLTSIQAVDPQFNPLHDILKSNGKPTVTIQDPKLIETAQINQSPDNKKNQRKPQNRFLQNQSVTNLTYTTNLNMRRSLARINPNQVEYHDNSDKYVSQLYSTHMRNKPDLTGTAFYPNKTQRNNLNRLIKVSNNGNAFQKKEDSFAEQSTRPNQYMMTSEEDRAHTMYTDSNDPIAVKEYRDTSETIRFKKMLYPSLKNGGVNFKNHTQKSSINCDHMSMTQSNKDFRKDIGMIPSISRYHINNGTDCLKKGPSLTLMNFKLTRVKKDGEWNNKMNSIQNEVQAFKPVEYPRMEEEMEKRVQRKKRLYEKIKTMQVRQYKQRISTEETENIEDMDYDIEYDDIGTDDDLPKNNHKTKRSSMMPAVHLDDRSKYDDSEIEQLKSGMDSIQKSKMMSKINSNKTSMTTIDPLYKDNLNPSDTQRVDSNYFTMGSDEKLKRERDNAAENSNFFVFLKNQHLIHPNPILIFFLGKKPLEFQIYQFQIRIILSNLMV